MNRQYELSLGGEAFTELRDTYDDVLTRTVANMEARQTEQATITLKLLIRMDRAKNVDGRMTSMPEFRYDISSMMQVRDRQSGILDENYEVACENGAWIIRPVDDGQLEIEGCESGYEAAEETGLKELGGETEEADDYDWILPLTLKESGLHVEKRGTAACLVTNPDSSGSVRVVLSSKAGKNTQLYCPAEELMRHVENRIVLSRDTKDGIPVISFCDCTAGEVFHTVEGSPMQAQVEDTENPFRYWEYLLDINECQTEDTAGLHVKATTGAVGTIDRRAVLLTDEGNMVVLSSVEDLGSPLYVPYEILAAHKGNKVRMSRELDKEQNREYIVFWDTDAKAPIHEVYAPEGWEPNPEQLDMYGEAPEDCQDDEA